MLRSSNGDNHSIPKGYTKTSKDIYFLRLLVPVLLVNLLLLLWSGFPAVIDPNIAQLNDYSLLNLLVN